ncbi:hypothetical protein V7S43_016079 [Phytophthora oleae]|uniref:PHD-type domain-containing protein n=1 Tax=Phytophthora oleae TaxID=2107226 RepID=A0ABD3EXC6_9STRA
MEESTQMRKSAVEMSHSQPTRGRNTGINGAAKPSTSATQPAARTKEKVELKQGDGAPAVEVVEKKVVVTPEKKKKEAEEKQAQKENETVASSTAGKIAKQSEKVVAEVRKEEKVDPFFQSREFDAIEFKASDFPSVSDGLAVARRSHPPAPSTNPAPLGQSTTVPTASKPNDVPGSAKVPTVAPVTASVVPSSTTTKATPAAKTTAVTVASKVSTTTAIAAPPSMGKTKSALKAPTESVLKATPQSNTPKPPAATPATKTPATPSKTAVATPSTKVPATQSTTAAVPRTTQAVPIPRQSRLAPRTRISPGPPPAAPVPLPSKPVTPTPSTMKPRSRTETATTPPPASKPTARVPVAATSAATKPSTAPAPGQNQANGNANVLLPKKRRSEEVPRADEAKRQAKAPLTTVKAPADGEGVEFVKVNAAPRAIPPVEPPVLGYCTPDFLAFMRECGDEDGDEEDDPEEESRSQLKLLDVVDLTNLSDSEDSETESPMPTPRGVPLQSLPATGQAAAVNEPTATANVNVSGTGTWYVPTLDSERKRTRPEKVMCELCEEKGSPSRLIHCSTCTKYYHKKCAKENGDENICWNCELGSMIDDSELDEEHARHSSDYLAYLKAIRRSSSPESEENEEEASGENEEQEGEEVEDGDVEMPNADAGEEDNNPFSEENNAKKAGKSWMEFVGDVTGDVDAGFQEVTNRIAEELRDEEKRRLYSRGFVSRAEFEAQMTEVEEYYISEEARLQQLEREKAIEAKKAAEARKAQAEAEEKTSSDQPGSSATSVPSIPASVAQGDATGSAGGAVSSALPSSTSATPVALSGNTSMAATSPVVVSTALPAAIPRTAVPVPVVVFMPPSVPSATSTLEAFRAGIARLTLPPHSKS